MSINILSTEPIEHITHYLHGKHISCLYATGNSLLISKITHCSLNLKYSLNLGRNLEMLNNDDTRLFFNRKLVRFGRKVISLDIKNCKDMIPPTHPCLSNIVNISILFVYHNFDAIVSWLNTISNPLPNLKSLELYRYSSQFNNVEKKVYNPKYKNCNRSITTKIGYLFPALETLALDWPYDSVKNLPPRLTRLIMGENSSFNNEDIVIFPDNITRLCFDLLPEKNIVILPKNLYSLKTNKWRGEFNHQNLTHLRHLDLLSNPNMSNLPPNVSHLSIESIETPLHIHANVQNFETTNATKSNCTIDAESRIVSFKNNNNLLKTFDILTLTSYETSSHDLLDDMSSKPIRNVQKIESFVIDYFRMWHTFERLTTLKIHKTEYIPNDLPNTLTELDIGLNSLGSFPITCSMFPSSLTKIKIRPFILTYLDADFNLNTPRFDNLKEFIVTCENSQNKLMCTVGDIPRFFSRNIETLYIDAMITNMTNLVRSGCVENIGSTPLGTKSLFDIPESLTNVDINIYTHSGMVNGFNQYDEPIALEKWVTFFNRFTNSFNVPLRYINLCCKYQFYTLRPVTLKYDFVPNPSYFRTDELNFYLETFPNKDDVFIHHNKSILTVKSKHLE